MSTPNEIKKNIAKDWNKAFPELSIFAQNKLYKIIGPIATGIELINLPRSDDYRPHFVIYPLWKKSAAESMEYPGMLTEFKDRKGFQFDIPYSAHENYFEEVVECVKKQLPLKFYDSIILADLLTTLKNYSVNSYLAASPASLLQGRLYQFMLYCALYANNREEIERLLKYIKQKEWNVKHFAAAKIDPIIWINGLETTVNNRDQFIAQIAENKEDKKLKKLQQSELLP
jgi:hypothetical protein